VSSAPQGGRVGGHNRRQATLPRSVGTAGRRRRSRGHAPAGPVQRSQHQRAGQKPHRSSTAVGSPGQNHAANAEGFSGEAISGTRWPGRPTALGAPHPNLDAPFPLAHAARSALRILRSMTAVSGTVSTTVSERSGDCTRSGARDRRPIADRMSSNTRTVRSPPVLEACWCAITGILWSTSRSNTQAAEGPYNRRGSAGWCSGRS
jgi:hypothetical protein